MNTLVEPKPYRMTVSPLDGRYQIESYDRQENQWFLLSVDSSRERAIQQLNFLFGSAQGEPRLSCPGCGRELAYPGPCFVGDDNIFYCGEGCSILHAANQLHPATHTFLVGALVGCASTVVLFVCGILCYWYTSFSAAVAK